MVFTLDGMVMLARFVQPLKAYEPMLVTCECNVKEVIEEQPVNA